MILEKINLDTEIQLRKRHHNGIIAQILDAEQDIVIPQRAKKRQQILQTRNFHGDPSRRIL
jgi:hypothetical protein